MSSVRAIALEFLSRGGKMLRPRLCRIVYGALVPAGAPPAGDIEAVASAVECFHKASLIHDDIQDGDTVRYGRPAVHAAHGVPVAIAVGDWLVAEGYRRLAASGSARAGDMLAAAAEAHLALSEGQGDELCLRDAPGGLAAAPRAARVSICRRKTGEAFALAARLGAIAASPVPDPAAERALRAFGCAFGVLFQARDDADDRETALAPEDLDAARAECAAAADALPPPLRAALARWGAGYAGQI